eukprot:CAMPEP_0202978090 /NCGR_PEP_ID=MMETSP1396-20130829/84635_1 /ASSEMBLY_ACC=CAM_ASM_000872 /TAXON_ID= /ORGANISM="Pseudokeronopsis sp., Strain Brazil" /LENGTH=166 /DNA_ID=CAMNT_0049716959 /DNA_START=788 /DNA_END=1288 /DNA_ORIENTATION=-
MAEGESDIEVSGKTSREVLKLRTNQSDPITPFTFYSSFNNKQFVKIPDQQMLALYGVQSVESSFSLSDNSSSPVETVVDVNAYNVNKTVVGLQFEKGDEITLQFEIKDDFVPLFYNLSKRYPVCKYFDKESGYWSQYGLERISYENETGIIQCKTSHLSKFTVDFI